jgi:hypothetical protein
MYPSLVRTTPEPVPEAVLPETERVTTDGRPLAAAAETQLTLLGLLITTFWVEDRKGTDPFAPYAPR